MEHRRQLCVLVVVLAHTITAVAAKPQYSPFVDLGYPLPSFLPQLQPRELLVSKTTLLNCTEAANGTIASKDPLALCSRSGRADAKYPDKLFGVSVRDATGTFELSWNSSTTAIATAALVQWSKQGPRLPGSDGENAGHATGSAAEMSEAGGASIKKKRAVFGSDDRVHPGVKESPYSQIGRLTYGFTFCTATLVYRNLILTAAHCILDNNFEFFPLSGITFTLGHDSGESLATAFIDKIWVSSQYKNRIGCPDNCHFSDDDWAIIRLDRPLGARFGWLPMIDFDPGDDNCEACSQGMELAGYSGDPACSYGNSLCTHKGCSIINELIFSALNLVVGSNIYLNKDVAYAGHNCDLQGGASGSAIINFETKSIYGVHVQSSLKGGQQFPVFDDVVLKNLGIANKAVPTAVFFQNVVNVRSEEQANIGNRISSAIYISSLPYTEVGNTTSLTNDFSDGSGPDVYYYFTPSAATVASVDTCGSSYDTIIHILEWEDESLISREIGYTDQLCSNQTSPEVIFKFEAKKEYMIILGGASETSYGAYAIQIIPFNLTGNSVSFPMSVSAPPPIIETGNSMLFTNDADLGHGPDVFYSFHVSTDMELTIDTCDSLFDTVIGVYSVVDGTIGNLLASNDDNQACGDGLTTQSLISFEFQADNSYIIVVDGYSFISFGDYQLRLLQPIGKGSESKQMIDIPFPLPFSHFGNSEGLSNDVDLGSGPDIFYQISTPTDTAVTIDTCGSQFDTVIGIYSSTEGNIGTLLQSNDNTKKCTGSSSTQSSISIVLQAGSSYIIVVDGKNPSSFGLYQIRVWPAGSTPYLCGDRLVVNLGEINSNSFIASSYLQSHQFAQDTDLCIIGTQSSDEIFGGDGDDVIFGYEGDDLIDGGEGDDILIGGKGKDELKGKRGKDSLKGGPGADSLEGGLGKDRISGGAGKDTLKGNGGKDVLVGGQDSDTIFFCAHDKLEESLSKQQKDIIILC